MKFKKLYLTIFTVIFIDQMFKLTIFFNFNINEFYKIPIIGNIISIYLLLNPGIAFGLSFLNFNIERIILLILRILFLTYIYKVFTNNNKFNKKNNIVYGTGMILGGGISNTIDWIFYGLLLDIPIKNAPFNLFYGNVIDIFYLPFLENIFSFVFNIADFSIFLGIIIYFLRK